MRPTSTNHLSHFKFVFAARSQVIQLGEGVPSHSAGLEHSFRNVTSLSPLSPEGYSRYNGLHREAPPESDTFFRLQVIKG